MAAWRGDIAHEHKGHDARAVPGYPRDNFSLLSGNLLPTIADWQRFTDRQPQETAVMVMPSPTSPLRRVYHAVARVLKERGTTVKLSATNA